MVQFLFSPAGSNTSEYIMGQVLEKLESKANKIIVMVPEQFSFETERTYFAYLGPKLFKDVEVLSFTRLANKIFREYGGLAKDYADEPTKNILMVHTLNEVRDQLYLYKKSVDKAGFLQYALETIAEFKRAGISPLILEKAIVHMKDSNLKQKLQEIFSIYSVYDGLLSFSYADALNDTQRALEKIRGKDFFAGYTIYFYGFHQFDNSQCAMIQEMLSSADDVCFTLGMDEESLSEKMGLFAPVIATYDRLKQLARQENIKIAPPVTIPQDTQCTSAELMHLKRNFLRYSVEEYPGKTEDIHVFSGENVYQEVEYVLSSIKEHVRRGYRYRDMVILAGNLEAYKSVLLNAFAQFDIPYFMDERKSIEYKPIVRFIQALLEGASGHYSSVKMLNIIKCGLTRFSAEDISAFENYLYTWDGHALSFTEDFTYNPKGFSKLFTEEDKIRLQQINRMRGTLVEAVELLKRQAAGKTARDIGNGIYEAMEFLGTKDVLEEQARLYIRRQKLLEAEEIQRLWDIVMEILSLLHANSAGKRIDLPYYRQLFRMVAKTYDLGESPQTLDMVIAGSADRMRVEPPKIVFVLGANEGVFPAPGQKGGFFSDQEREKLIEIGLEVDAPSYIQMTDKRYLAYEKVCLPTEKLFISYQKADIGGAPMEPSEIVRSVFSIFPSLHTANREQLGIQYFCQSEKSSFSQLAEHFREDTEQTAMLRRYFHRNTTAQGSLEGLYRALQKPLFTLTDKKIPLDLYGQRITLSPTKLEEFKKCKFAYFCKNGLQVRPPQKAELNPMEQGNVYHSILNDALLDFDRFIREDRESLEKRTVQLLVQYADEHFGGVKDKTERFQYLFKRHRKPLTDVLERIQQEFQQSRFQPADFELPIQDKRRDPLGEKSIPPMAVRTKDGIEVVLEGRIDRVDVYSENGVTYVRVVDYKTGSKLFSFGDIPYGMNMQMMFYLFTIWENGSVRYGTVLPAGILYMPVGEPSFALKRTAAESEAAAQRGKQYKMKGVLLEDSHVIQAMEKIEYGEYASFLPLRLSKNGSVDSRFKENIVTKEEMGMLQQYAKHMLTEMAEDLYQGKIEAVPLEGACEYCEYTGVCGAEEGDPVIQIEERKKEQVLKEIAQEETISE